MRKLSVLLTFIAVFAASVFADPIDPVAAYKIAERLMADNGGALRASEPLTLAYTRTSERNELRGGMPAQNYYYIFNRGTNGGFVIVAADDLMPEVLGFSDKGSIDPHAINPNLAYWLEGYVQSMDYAIKHNVSMRAPATSSLRLEGDIAPLVQSQWDQAEPYNLQTPMISATKHGYTGCVATAVAQIMRYHSWPDVGEGTHSYTEDRGSQGGYINHTTTFDTYYDWANMRYQYAAIADVTTAQKNAVAKLMADVGMAINMTYYREASGTTSEHVIRALRQHFKYRKDLQMITRASVSLETFETAILTDLRAGRPVYYAGGNSLEGGGHAFVCDGYDAATQTYHFNWGWGGFQDGYFALTRLTPGAGGIGSGSAKFNDDQEVIVGITPARTDEDKAAAAPDPRMAGIISLRKFDPTTKIATVRTYIYTPNSYAIPAYTGLGLFSGSDLIQTYNVIHRYVHYMGIKRDGMGLDFQRQITSVDLSQLADGEYTLAPVWSFASDQTADLKPTGMERRTIARINVKVQGGQITVVEDLDPIENLELLPNGIETSDNLTAFDDKGFITLKLRNKGSVVFYNYVTLGLQDVNTGDIYYGEDRTMLNIDPGKEGLLRFDFRPEVNITKGLGFRVPAPEGVYRPFLVYNVTSRFIDNPQYSDLHNYHLETDQTIRIGVPETPANNAIVISREDGSVEMATNQNAPSVRVFLTNRGANSLKNAYILAILNWGGNIRTYDAYKINELPAGEQLEYTAPFSSKQAAFMSQPGIYDVTFRICRAVGATSLDPYTTGYTFGRTRYTIIAFGRDPLDKFDVVSTTNVLEQTTDALRVYPIPAHTNLYVDTAEDDLHELRIFDTTGRLVLKQTLSTNPSGIQQISVDGLPEGLYIMQALYADGKGRTMRISIKR